MATVNTFALTLSNINNNSFEVIWPVQAPYYNLLNWTINFNIYQNALSIANPLLTLTNILNNGIISTGIEDIIFSIPPDLLDQFNGTYYYTITGINPVGGLNYILEGNVSIGPFSTATQTPTVYAQISSILSLDSVTANSITTQTLTASGGSVNNTVIGNSIPQSANFTNASYLTISPSVAAITPTNNQTVTINNNISIFAIQYVGVIGTLVLTLPPNPVNNQLLTITTNAEIQTLFITANVGQSFSDNPIYMPPNSGIDLYFYQGVWNIKNSMPFINGTYYFTPSNNSTTELPNNYTNFVIEGSVSTPTVTTQGAGYQITPTVSISPPDDTINGTQATATATLSFALSGISISNGGSGYTAPTLTISAPTGINGVQATGTLTVSGGIITGVTITNFGFGYLTTPTYTITDSTGTGAVLAISLNTQGALNNITITNPGSGYTNPYTFTISGGSPTTAAVASSTLSLAASTLSLPLNPYNNQEIYIFCPFPITTLTINSSQSLVGTPPTSISISTLLKFRFFFDKYYYLGDNVV